MRGDDPIIPTRTPAQIAADNRAELDTWIAERTAELIRSGMAPDEAGRQAAREFGDVAAAEAYGVQQDVAADRRVRGLLWLEELAADLRIAFRTLARTPTVTAVVLLTFALGIGATTAVFSVVHAILLRPLPYGNAASLVYLQATDRGVVGPNPRLSSAALVALRERTTVFAGIAGAGTGNYVLTENGDPEQLMGADVTPNMFEVLQTGAALGRSLEPGDEQRSDGLLVLGSELWQRRFGGDPGIVGRTIAMDNQQWLVVGVMPREVRVPTYEEAQFWAPRDLSGLLANPNARHVRFMRLFGRLKPGVSLDAAQADVDRVMTALQTEEPRWFGEVGARVVPMRTALAGEVQPRILLLLGAAAFVLLIACANVGGILLSRALARRHELSVRVALGAGRRRLVRYFLAEGAVLAVLGAGLGIAVAQAGIVALRTAAAGALPAGTTFALAPQVLLFAIGTAVAAALAASLVPALGATRVPGVALRREDGRASLSRAGRRLRLALVTGQLAVALVLLVGAGLFLRSLERLSSLELGYRTDHALTFRLQFTGARGNPEQDALWTELYAGLKAIPGVVSVAAGNLPLTGQSTVSGLDVEGRPAEGGRLPDVRYSTASDGYFATLGIPVEQGRVFGPEDRDDAPWVAVVSAGLARQLWPGGSPIGARVKVEPTKPWATIVGVVGDVGKGSAEPPQPSVYTSQRQDHWRNFGAVMIRTTGSPEAAMAGVRAVVKRLDPTVPIIGLRSLEDLRRSTPAVADRRVQMQLLLVFALVALLVSGIGVYGVSAFATEARRLEFGIRMALGATRGGVLRLAFRDGAVALLLGTLAGVPLAGLLAWQARALLFRVPPFDPAILGVVLGVLMVVVCAAALVPARRAARMDPVRAIRVE